MRGDDRAFGFSLVRRPVGFAVVVAATTLGLLGVTASGVFAQSIQPTNPQGTQGITVNGGCFASTTSGTITLLNLTAADSGNTITLEVYAHPNNPPGPWVATGATTTVTVTGTGTQTFKWTISGLAQSWTESPYNTLRVQVAGESPAGWATGATTKSLSLSACTPFIVAESPLAVGLPIAAVLLFGGAFALVVIRRRRHIMAA